MDFKNPKEHKTLYSILNKKIYYLTWILTISKAVVLQLINNVAALALI